MKRKGDGWCCSRNYTCVKRLEFLSPRNLHSKHYATTSSLNTCTQNQVEKPSSEIGLLKNNKELLEINTPQRAELLKRGIQNKSVLNVLGSGTFGTVVEGKYKSEFIYIMSV